MRTKSRGSCVTCPSTKDQTLYQHSVSSSSCTHKAFSFLGRFCSTQATQVVADIYPRVLCWPFRLEERDLEMGSVSAEISTEWRPTSVCSRQLWDGLGRMLRVSYPAERSIGAGKFKHQKPFSQHEYMKYLAAGIGCSCVLSPLMDKGSHVTSLPATSCTLEFPTDLSPVSLIGDFHLQS